MGDAQRRMALQREALIQQLTQDESAGPPPKPCQETPGPMTRQYISMAERYLANWAEQHDGQQKVMSPTEAVTMLTHMMDMMAWESANAQHEQKKAMLEQMTRRVLVPTLAPGGIVVSK